MLVLGYYGVLSCISELGAASRGGGGSLPIDIPIFLYPFPLSLFCPPLGSSPIEKIGGRTWSELVYFESNALRPKGNLS